jgi:hypothetical protein
MINRQTARALNRRALEAADFLEGYARHFEGELRKQNLLFGARKPNSTMTLPAGLMLNLIEGMQKHAKELRCFAKEEPPKRTTWPHGFSQ